MTETLVFKERLDSGLHFFAPPGEKSRGWGFMPNNPKSLSIARQLNKGDNVTLTKIENYQPGQDDFDLLQEKEDERVFCNCMELVKSKAGPFIVTSLS